ncbi:MAG: hypothetical protein GY847_15720 [Proteobacteria bacterium]|nr:hypothetical protein [Pseudomonadota bacterium]
MSILTDIKVLLLTCLLGACGGQTLEPIPPITNFQKAKIPTEKPKPVFHWKVKGEASTYNPDNIWDAINGAAEIYVAYGFQELIVQEYEIENLVANLEIFDQGAPINAFGVFSRERPPNGKPIEVGAQAVALEPYQCTMIKGQYYVRAQNVQGKLNANECRDLLNTAAQELPGGNDLPAELSRLPSQRQVKDSLGYTRKSYLGVADLTDCLYAKYTEKNSKTYELFTILKESEQAWNKLTGNWKSKKAGSLKALYREIPYRGKVVVVKTPNGIFGIVGAKDLQSATNLLKNTFASD